MESKKGTYWKILKRVAGYFLLFVAAVVAYYSLFVLFLGEVKGKTGFGALYALFKAIFTLDTLSAEVEISISLLFIGIPSIFIAWLSEKLSNKLNFTLLPVISLAVSLFAAPLAHIVIFHFPLNADIEQFMNFSIVTAAVFELIFAFAVAVWRVRQRKRFAVARAAAGWENISGASGDGAQWQSSTGEKSAYWKFAGGYLAIILVAGVALIGLGAYQLSARRQAVDNLAKSFEEARQANYERALADTYGGKTPQETLSLYIDAVEAGDYELASRYFVKENRQRELESFARMGEDAIRNYINLIENTLIRIDVEGKYSSNKEYFSIYEPILVRMFLYPNGTWKIIEI